VLNHLQRIGKVELPDFEPILGSEKQFSTEIKWNFFSNSRWLTEAENSTEDLGNRNALGFHIPKMWDKILISTNVIYRKIHQTQSETK
jgi:23S rRNA (uracil1939-C5)-methyltransferase